MSKGKFIVFEGPDYSGKGTFIDATIAAIGDSKRVRKFRTIGEGPLGERLRDTVVNKPEGTPFALSEAFIFLAAISDCYYNYVLPWVESGGIAIMDRYCWSTYVYQDVRITQQVATMSLDIDKSLKLLDIFARLKTVVKTMPKPDVIVFLEIEKDQALTNASVRNANTEANPLDNFSLANHNELSFAYREIADYCHITAGRGKVIRIANTLPYSQEKTKASVAEILKAIG